MVDYRKIYMDYMGYTPSEFVPCEICGKKAVDIHHIRGRGKGMDVISNLMAVCRSCHNKAHGGTKTYLHKDVMQKIHDNYLKNFCKSNN